MQKSLKNIVKKSFWTKSIGTQKGSIELLGLCLPSFVVIIGLILLFKGVATYRLMHNRAQLYLCTKSVSIETQKNFTRQIRLNITIETLEQLLIADIYPGVAQIRKNMIRVAKWSQEATYISYLNKVRRNKNCSLLN